jgi:Tol biopolymer transport system component/C-terminal processing protease CtpA/Prc
MTDSQLNARPYFRTPALAPDGKLIAFAYAADIWIVDVNGGDAERLTAHPSRHSAPRWSPDGQQLAFSSNRTGQGDLYTLPLREGTVRRVTFHDAASATEAWSIDGSQLYFSSAREQQSSAIYRVAAAGGTPIQWISQPYEQLNGLSISPDGSLLAFNVSRDAWWRRGPNPYGGAEIWLGSNAIDADDYRLFSDYVGMNRWPLWSPDGQGLYFVSDRDGMENLWFKPLEGGTARKITSFSEGRLLWPTISADGRTIVFERDFSIWRLDVPSGVVSPLPIRVRPDTKITPVRVQTYSRELSELELSPDGKKIAYVVRGAVFADFADKETDKEQRQGPSFRVTNTPFRESDVVWSPDSARIAYISDRHGDEELYLYTFASNTETRLTNSPRPKSAPRYSPDGAWIAFARGDDEIRLLNTATNEDRPFARANFNQGTSLAWSPDSKWLVFIAQDERFFSNLYVQRIDEDTARQITFLSNIHAYGPLWAANGRFILFTTSQYRAESQIARVDLRPLLPAFREAEFEKLFDPPANDNGRKKDESPPAEEQASDAEPQVSESAEQPPQPEPIQGETKAQEPAPKPHNVEVVIVFDGIERRLRFLTPIQLDASAQCISPDSRDLIFSATVTDKLNLWSMPLDEPRQEQPPRQLTSGTGYKWAVQFAPDGKSFYFLDTGQIMIRKFPGGEQSALPISADVIVDFNQEKIQIFDECWRLLRDQFYDPTFRGLDWSAARTQFAPLAAGAQTAGDLLAIVNLMVGELRASHLGLFPTNQPSVQNGYIGLLFDRAEQASAGRLRVSAIIPDSPAALAGDDQGIQVGDYVVAVEGVPIEPTTNLDRLLQRTVGRRVRLRIETPAQAAQGAQNPGDRAGAAPAEPPAEPRELAVRPIAADHYDRLRYRNWAYANERYVHQISGGRLGYVHIRRMSYDAYQQFLADLDAEAHSKEGVVVDVRFNGGGHIATFILDVLTRRSIVISALRDRPPMDASHLAGNRVLNKPTVLLINEGSGSNTEMFTESYRRLGLGKVVGRPSAGAVIWTTGRRLLDGSLLRLPYIKVTTPEGEDLEGTGRAVDVDVALPVGEPARGRDSQLDAAVAALLAQLDSPPA